MLDAVKFPLFLAAACFLAGAVWGWKLEEWRQMGTIGRGSLMSYQWGYTVAVTLMAWAAEMYVMAFSAVRGGLGLVGRELVGLEGLVIAASCLIPGTAWLIGGYQMARRRLWILEQPRFALLTFPFGLLSRRYSLQRAREFQP